MKYEDLRRKILNKPEVKRILREKKLAFQIADMVLQLRMAKGLTQEKLAKKIGTKQPAIARIENGDILPSLELLQKIAKALKMELIMPRFDCLSAREKPQISINGSQFDWYREITITSNASYFLGKFNPRSVGTITEIPKKVELNCAGA